MRLSIRPGALIISGLAMMAPALALASTDEVSFAISADMKRIVLSIPAFLLGIGLHEWAHAWVAWRLGDSTPEEEGRLSLNPLDHLDPLGTLLILGAAIWNLPLLGWGKPVNIRPSAFRNPIRDKMKVALAGPMMNLAVAAGALLAYHGVEASAGLIQRTLGDMFMVNCRMLLETLIVMNFCLAVFNMIPVPPLDGSKVLENFVSARTVITLREIEPYGMLILYGLINTPIMSTPFYAVYQGVFWLMGNVMFAVGYGVLVSSAWFLMVRSVRLR